MDLLSIPLGVHCRALVVAETKTMGKWLDVGIAMHSRSTGVGYILAKRSLDTVPCNMGSGWIPGWIFPVGSV